MCWNWNREQAHGFLWFFARAFIDFLCFLPYPNMPTKKANSSHLFFRAFVMYVMLNMSISPIRFFVGGYLLGYYKDKLLLMKVHVEKSHFFWHAYGKCYYHLHGQYWRAASFNREERICVSDSQSQLLSKQDRKK